LQAGIRKHQVLLVHAPLNPRAAPDNEAGNLQSAESAKRDATTRLTFLGVAWALILFVSGCGPAPPSAASSDAASASATASAPVEPTPTAAPTGSTAAAYPDACQAVTLGARGEWQEASLHWDSASVAASTAGDFAAAEVFGAVFSLDTLKISEDAQSAMGPDIATYQADLADHAVLMGGC
jgi:hypothetical protein